MTPDWICRGRTLSFADGPLVMGILNVTPDSFSDGGAFTDTAGAVRHGRDMAEAGAAIIDVGGESTRPGAPPVSARDEAARVLPVIEALAGHIPAVVSVDTSKADVARRALEAGAAIINDVTAGAGDPAMLGVAAESGAGLVLMHMQGTPRTMQRNPRYGNVVREVRDFLAARLAACADAGIESGRLAVDPGIGFGKTLEHNLRLLARLDALRPLGRPVVVGLSRKRFLGMLTGRDVQNRLAAGLGALTYCVLHGADVMRVHDVPESVDAMRTALRVKEERRAVVD
ncbi:MAG: dihydropteroate synthase [Lentisphaerae bacterium]|nr:dihydropteroate synthase [Lentisphaerota bacterium]